MLNDVRASYRFLLAEPGVFTTLWDWSCFLDSVQLLADFELHEDEELKRNILDLRWCSIQILSMVLKINDRASSNFGLASGEAFLCLLRLVCNLFKYVIINFAIFLCNKIMFILL